MDKTQIEMDKIDTKIDKTDIEMDKIDLKVIIR